MYKIGTKYPTCSGRGGSSTVTKERSWEAWATYRAAENTTMHCNGAKYFLESY